MSDPMLQPIPGNPADIKSNVLRHNNIDRHLEAMQAEFIGKPYVCWLLVTYIIKLRRNIDVNANKVEFTRLLGTYADVLISNYDVRWLVSICDTIADYGDELLKPRAMMIVNFVNMIKLNDTVLLIAKDPTPDPTKVQNFKVSPTWGGMTSYDIRKGDMTKNMFGRLDKVLDPTPMLKKIFKKIINQTKKTPNSVSDLAKHHQTSFWGKV